MINAEEHGSGPCKSICEDLRKCEVRFARSDAWNRAWALRFDRTARQLHPPGYRGLVLTSWKDNR